MPMCNATLGTNKKNNLRMRLHYDATLVYNIANDMNFKDAL